MVSKKCNENDIRVMFSPFGQIEECRILRGPDGLSRVIPDILKPELIMIFLCNALVSQSMLGAKQSLLRHVVELLCVTSQGGRPGVGGWTEDKEEEEIKFKPVHENVTVSCIVQGCSSPIVVKFADTQKDKEQRRLQQQLAQQMQQLNTATWGNLTGLGGLTPQYLALLQQATSSSNLGAFSGIQQMAGMNALQLQNLATLAAAAAAAQTSATTTNANPLSTTTGALGALTSPVAASTANSTAGAAMNSLTSLGTLQGLAGATVGLNNINALAGTTRTQVK
ncbi:hypothetical protein DV515_00007589, partial [Chloebia gouldiae]